MTTAATSLRDVMLTALRRIQNAEQRRMDYEPGDCARAEWRWMQGVLEAAEVPLDELDLRHLEWLARWELESIAVVMALIVGGRPATAILSVLEAIGETV